MAKHSIKGASKLPQPDSVTSCLRRLTKLKVYNAKYGEAPHKPLLLLVLIELAERDELPNDILLLTPELAFRFDTFWEVGAYRRPQPPDVRLPFHHLGGDDLLSPFMDSGEPSPDAALTRFVRLDTEFVAAARDSGFRDQARRFLIARYFQPAERNALFHLIGMPIPPDDQIAADASYEVPEDAERKGRETRFRLDIVPAYNYTCALTGYRVTTIAAGSIVDAAHIHEFSDSRNNDPGNGVALCKNAHWLFDAGLWSIDDEYRVIVAKGAFSESSPNQKPVSDFHGQTLLLPANQSIWPSLKHLAWHRKKFKFDTAT